MNPPAPYAFYALCEALGKGQMYVKNLMRQLGLPVLMKGQRYSESYCRLMRRVIALRTFSVSLELIGEVLEKEKKLLRMMHFDVVGESQTWWLDGCCPELSDRCLLLTGIDMGFSLRGGHVQDTLDFGERDPELFKSAEMGESVRVVLDKYLELVETVSQKLRQEDMVLRDALRWARQWEDTGVTARVRSGRAMQEAAAE